MRKQFSKVVSSFLDDNPESALFLGDIGVYAFRKSLMDYPERAFNIGILEQSMIGLAAGFSLRGFMPIVHTIAPFLVERAYEQLKVDFGYQNLPGRFITVGGSVDYAALGCTHHCPGDISAILGIPNFQLVVPGTGGEFESLFAQSATRSSPIYFRLSEKVNSSEMRVEYGRANLVREGEGPLVIAFGPALDMAMDAAKKNDASVLYYTTVLPFDYEALQKNSQGKSSIIVVEPFYEGTTLHLINPWVDDSQVISFGLPRKFLTAYGTTEEHYEAIGFTSKRLSEILKNV